MYPESKNQTMNISDDVLLALIEASSAYLAEPTTSNWHNFQELSDHLLRLESQLSTDNYPETSS